MKYLIILALGLATQFAQAQTCPGFSSVDEANAFADASTLASLKFLKAKYKNEGVKVEQVAFLGEAVVKGQQPTDCELMNYQSEFEVTYLKESLGCIVRGQILASAHVGEEVKVEIVDGSVGTPDCRELSK